MTEQTKTAQATLAQAAAPEWQHDEGDIAGLYTHTITLGDNLPMAIYVQAMPSGQWEYGIIMGGYAVATDPGHPTPEAAHLAAMAAARAYARAIDVAIDALAHTTGQPV